MEIAEEIVFGSLNENGMLYPLYLEAKIKGKKIAILKKYL